MSCLEIVLDGLDLCVYCNLMEVVGICESKTLRAKNTQRHSTLPTLTLGLTQVHVWETLRGSISEEDEEGDRDMF